MENSEETVSALATNSDQPPLSKRQKKRLEKRKKWIQQKPLRRAKEKLKRKQKIQAAKENGRDLGPSRKILKSLKMADSSCKLKVCFDLSLADVMTPPEFSKTFKQLHRCYSINRRAKAPLQLYITGFTDSTKETMSKMSGCFNWDVNFSQELYSKVFSKEDIIYLTSDSPNVLDELDYNKAYIIGALVDHNRLKNICYERAQKEGVGHARLPLDIHFKFKTRKVLTIDQVYLIFLRLTEGKSWIEAILETVPKRKGVELLNDSYELSRNSFVEGIKGSVLTNVDSKDTCNDKTTESENIK
ncbi:tRNA methyltransferase 10 homolog A-like [Stegodyphus dumicola]|uniref:tRNA methyltransferase 10 homolog A-like n=1 Tax=Stegodyphus dumicola TaxID=202533 RepID=UPI0015AD845F|nr:tRNA methyltransferase 10 homolog A-like [Stegodyphus dumicola]